MRLGTVTTALVLLSCCARTRATIQADDAHTDASPAAVEPDACERMLGTWKMREVVDDHGVHPQSLRVLRILVGEIVNTYGDEATQEEREPYRVLERGRDLCRIRKQAGQILDVRPIGPQILEFEAAPIVSRWVRVTEPLPSPP